MRKTHQCALGDLGLILMPHLKVEVVAGRHKVQRQQLVETDQGKTCIELKLFTNEGWVIPEADLAGVGAQQTRGGPRVVHRLTSGGLMVCQGRDGASQEVVGLFVRQHPDPGIPSPKSWEFLADQLLFKGKKFP